jgi:hypothetical protein
MRMDDQRVRSSLTHPIGALGSGVCVGALIDATGGLGHDGTGKVGVRKSVEEWAAAAPARLRHPLPSHATAVVAGAARLLVLMDGTMQLPAQFHARTRHYVELGSDLIVPAKSVMGDFGIVIPRTHGPIPIAGH